jgi:hypothetical protein
MGRASRTGFARRFEVQSPFWVGFGAAPRFDLVAWASGLCKGVRAHSLSSSSILLKYFEIILAMLSSVDFRTR